jgi:uncharacterized membrane protein
MVLQSTAIETSLISPENVWTLWTLIVVGVAVSIYLEQQYRWAARLSGPVLTLIIAMILSNLGIMPKSSPVYDSITDYLVPVAVTLLLLRASLIDIIKTSRTAFVAVQIAIAGSILGAFVAGALMPQFGRTSAAASTDAAAVKYQKELPQLTGTMTASYIGGSVNFVAMKEIYNIDDALTSSLIVADNFVMAAAFVLIFSFASMPWMRKRYPHPHSLAETTDESREIFPEHRQPHTLSLLNIATGLAISVPLAAASTFIAQVVAGQLERSESSGHIANSMLVPIVTSLIGSKYIWLTFLTITAATLFKRHLGRIHGTEEIGGYLLYLFLFTIGLPSDFVSVVTNVPSMFVLCTIIAVFNLGFTLLVGRLLRMNLEELLLASNATLGGPASAAAMAVSLGWKQLVTPGLLIGLWGYVVGTAIGVCVTEILKQCLTTAT